jgi:hypothetical protein
LKGAELFSTEDKLADRSDAENDRDNHDHESDCDKNLFHFVGGVEFPGRDFRASLVVFSPVLSIGETTTDDANKNPAITCGAKFIFSDNQFGPREPRPSAYFARGNGDQAIF